MIYSSSFSVVFHAPKAGPSTSAINLRNTERLPSSAVSLHATLLHIRLMQVEVASRFPPSMSDAAT